MNSLYDDLAKQIKNLEGNVLGIGTFDKKIMEAFKENNKLTSCNILSNDEMRKTEGNYKIDIKKLRKVFKKKKIDYIVCNIKDVKNYMRYFVKDSIYINKSKLFLYGLKEDYEFDEIEKRYNRYNTNIKTKEYKDGFLINVDTSKAKNNWIKDRLYLIKDFFVETILFIGDIVS